MVIRVECSICKYVLSVFYTKNTINTMRLKKLLKRTKSRFRRAFMDKPSLQGIEPFWFDKEKTVREHVLSEYNFDGELLDLLEKKNWGNDGDGLSISKWHHYIPIYDRYFSKYRGKRVRFLEIGVAKGGSLALWRRYFGPEAIIYGIDIKPSCEKYNGMHGEVRIGSQDDAQFLRSVVEEMGGVDVILDDGSHQMKHIAKTLKILLKEVDDGGVYMIEDLHTSYWNQFGGGFARKANFFNIVRVLIDDIHHWYHAKGLQIPEVSRHCQALHIYDSIVVIEKGRLIKPVHSRIF